MPRRKPPAYAFTQDELRALTEAGLVPLHRYIAVCAERGWTA